MSRAVEIRERVLELLDICREYGFSLSFLESDKGVLYAHPIDDIQQINNFDKTTLFYGYWQITWADGHTCFSTPDLLNSQPLLPPILSALLHSHQV